jgi:DHA1 family multidrug resistance protein-like MFS transporter
MKTDRRNITILFSTLVVVMLGFGIIIPIMPFYIKSFGASGKALGLLMTTYAVMQFIFAPFWGSLSDRYGRKPLLVIGVIGNALAHLLFGLSTELWMLFAARALAGMLSSATLPTAMAYVSDSTSEKERGGGMGLMSAAMGTGIILGPGVGGWLGGISLALPFFVASALSVIALLAILAFLPESLPKDKRVQHDGVGFSLNFGSMWQALAGPLAFLLMLSFLMDFGFTCFEGVFGLFALDYYGYGPGQVGTLLVMVGIISTIMQAVFTGPLTRRWGEAKIITACLLFSSIGFVLMLKATTLAGVILTVGFFVGSNAMLRPSISSFISKRSTGSQGQAMGLNNSFMSLGRIMGPASAGFLYDINISFPYLSGSVILLIGFFACLVWMNRGS